MPMSSTASWTTSMNESDVMSRWSLQAMMNREKSPSLYPGRRSPIHRLRSRKRQWPTSGEDEWSWHGTLCQSLTLEDSIHSGSDTEKPLLSVNHAANCLLERSVCSRATSWMPSVLKGFLALLWLSSNSSRSWILPVLPEPCPWNLESPIPSLEPDPSLLRCASCEWLT